MSSSGVASSGVAIRDGGGGARDFLLGTRFSVVRFHDSTDNTCE